MPGCSAEACGQGNPRGPAEDGRPDECFGKQQLLSGVPAAVRPPVECPSGKGAVSQVSQPEGKVLQRSTEFFAFSGSCFFKVSGNSSFYQEFRQRFDHRLNALREKLELLRTSENAAVVDEMAASSSTSSSSSRKLVSSLIIVSPFQIYLDRFSLPL